jgi:opacity protein-like surface antigen
MVRNRGAWRAWRTELGAALLATAGCAIGGRETTWVGDDAAWNGADATAPQVFVEPSKKPTPAGQPTAVPATVPATAPTPPNVARTPPEKRAADDVFRPETGPFVGLSAVYASLGGDFDGHSTFTASNGNEVDVVPKISDGFGGRIAGGYRFTHFAVEAAFQITGHDAEWNGRSNDVTCYSMELAGRWFTPTFWDRLRPSVMAGLVIPWLDVKNGSTGPNGSGGTSTDTATYSGYGANVGIGLDYLVTRHLSIDLLATWRWLEFTDLNGVNNSGSLDKNLRSNGFVFGVGSSWTF